ncbi:DUF4233 domain-containing protein [Kineococcus sp. LSe6-4]|uniref:DUF4233 domain-containing protein n=1 Tax=Kineococcus halophytocola TaxID=3234027 RepID=A0ABV4H0U1_9ACTN
MRNPKRLMAATTLGSEALVVFFATLVAYGLVPMAQRSATYLVVGGALVLLCLLAAGMLRRRGGYALGWVLQVAIVAGGFVVPLMFAVGGVFAIIWVCAIVVGNRIEREQAEVARRMAQE